MKALKIGRSLGQISAMRYLAEKSDDKKIAEDLSESCVTTEFTPGDFAPILILFSYNSMCLHIPIASLNVN